MLCCEVVLGCTTLACSFRLSQCLPRIGPVPPFFAWPCVRFPSPLAVMACSLSSELTFLLDRENVDTDFRDKLVEVGLNTVPKFAAVVDTAAEMRDLLKDDFGLDGKQGGLQVRSKVAAILVAWGTARKRSEKQAEVDGERDARREPKLIAQGDRVAVKKASKAKF